MPAHNPRGEPREASAAVYDSAADTLSSLQVPIVGSTPLTSLTPAVSGEIRLSTDDMISILPLTQSTTVLEATPATGRGRRKKAPQGPQLGLCLLGVQVKAKAHAQTVHCIPCRARSYRKHHREAVAGASML
ncbi:hypothetical protein PC114_g23435 [Phytophthora cactorum]|uniref:Uncharacterized protein n=1 Tax=Phytophthora cactorum TaxID=29920 RepID=A0A8T1BJF4_9STRA|nr:hypothetical protein PC114_g23435 [Phytophthora cactorum]KAG2904950.1 hypothetical protein PC117_g20873 [Phytophthora cactorum]KAG3056879.1 hypothetical protein PC122_g21223 [Phytophthora cactorum]